MKYTKPEVNIDDYSDSKRAPYKCRECGTTSDTPWGLKVHHRLRHEGPVKRKKRRKKSWPATQEEGARQAVPQQREVNHCPECGCNLAAVRIALNFRE